MATPQKSTRKPKSTKANDGSLLGDISTAPAAAPSKKKQNPLATANGLYGAVQTVTSNRLKRRFVNNGYHVSLFVPDTNYTQLSIIGLQLGVTWDEVLRGLIEMHLASSDQTGGLKHFIPALD